MIDVVRSVYKKYEIGRLELDDLERIRRAGCFLDYVGAGGVLVVDTDFYRLRSVMPEMPGAAIV